MRAGRLTVLLGLCAASGAARAAGVDGAALTAWWGLPFAGMLLSIALMPMLVPHFWHHHFGKVAAGWSLAMLLPFAALFGAGTAAQALVHTLVAEYLRRELLNLLLGNSDNHGRNIALLRGERPLRWAPIYDLAPMVMDPGGVTRTTTWPDPLERGGQLRWRDICRALAPCASGIDLWADLRDFAARLLPLPALLEEEGFPIEALNFPRIRVASLKKTLQDWGLQ